MMPVEDSANDRVRGGGPEQSFHEPHELFTVPAYTAEEIVNNDVHWQMGGHLSGADEVVTCSTCHSAHMPAENILVAYGAQEFQDVVCSGCHTDADNKANPGMTEFYHPALDESLPPYQASTTAGFDLAIQIPPEFPVGEDDQLLCTTCHVAHRGWEGRKAIRSPAVDSLYICDSCHLFDSNILEANSHHIVRYLDFTSTPPYAYENPSWWDGLDGTVGDLSDGLTCTDCHTELAKSAHNW
jgi:predicted CXXCH cytochrome family protein